MSTTPPKATATRRMPRGSRAYDPADFPDPTIVAVNDVELEVFEAGRQHAGNPIVRCHGWPEHAFSWRHQMSVLADAGYHVIVPNQRGYGAAAPRLEHFVPNADVVSLDCGHWIQEELPDQTNRTMLEWLGRHRVA